MGDPGNCRGVNLKTLSAKNVEMKLQNRIIKHLEDHLIRMVKPVWFLTMEIQPVQFFFNVLVRERERENQLM